MKRSEMIDRLVRVLKAERAYPYRGPWDIAEDLLKAIESTQMKPPAYTDEKGYARMWWEPEDD